MTSISRRKFLHHGAAVASVVTFNQLFGYNNLFAQKDGDSLETIIDLAVTAEALACTHYFTALTDSSIQLTPDERAFLVAILDTEHQHFQFLQEVGGEPLTTAFYAPLNVYNKRENFSNITQQAENAFVSAYLAAVRRVSELNDDLLSATIAQVVVTEGVHLALIRQLGGLLPNNVSLAQASYFNTSEVAPILQPFIEGGDGFIGPVTFPGDETIREFVKNSGVMAVEPFVNQASQS